jgi:hypothetical protein
MGFSVSGLSACSRSKRGPDTRAGAKLASNASARAAERRQGLVLGAPRAPEPATSRVLRRAAAVALPRSVRAALVECRASAHGERRRFESRAVCRADRRNDARLRLGRADARRRARGMRRRRERTRRGRRTLHVVARVSGGASLRGARRDDARRVSGAASRRGCLRFERGLARHVSRGPRARRAKTALRRILRSHDAPLRDEARARRALQRERQLRV